MARTDDAEALPFPAGIRIDPVRFRAWAESLNRWHAAMGTRLVAVDEWSVTLAMPWQPHLAAADGAGLANGVLAALLDHACALAGMLTTGDETKSGGTMGLRVDHLAPTRPGFGVHVVARGVHRADHVVTAQAEAFHPDEPRRLLAIVVSALAARP
jgi:uncharacterized protein (TIGR00369 family)